MRWYVNECRWWWRDMMDWHEPFSWRRDLRRIRLVLITEAIIFAATLSLIVLDAAVRMVVR